MCFLMPLEEGIQLQQVKNFERCENVGHLDASQKLNWLNLTPVSFTALVSFLYQISWLETTKSEYAVFQKLFLMEGKGRGKNKETSKKKKDGLRWDLTSGQLRGRQVYEKSIVAWRLDKVKKWPPSKLACVSNSLNLRR